MERTQGFSDKRFMFGKTEYNKKKVLWIPGKMRGRRVRIKTEVMFPGETERDWR